MAVAAYASLLSLMHVLDNVQHRARRHQLYLHTKQTQSLQEKVNFLLGYLELHSERISQEMEEVARQIVVVVDEAEHTIDFHVVDQLREGSQEKRRYMAALSPFGRDINNIIEGIDSITRKLMMVKEERVDVQEQPVVPVGSTTLPSSDKNTMVGVDERLLQVVDELTRDESNLQILPIVRMGGIVSQQYSVREILLKYLLTDKKDKKELEEIGRNIAKGCRGLPLAIVVVGGLLAKSKKTREYWEFVAENVSTIVNSGDEEYCLKILSLSYNSLPIHLKPCFLYMGVFPEDHEIKASELAKLWISEEFLKPVGGKTLEAVGEEYLKDLIDRNLILIRKRTCSGKIKTCSVHDMLRELCLRESNREHLVRVPKAQHAFLLSEHENSVCFLCGHLAGSNRIHLQEVLVGLRSTTIASPSVCKACNNMYQNLNRLRWVKVLEQIDPHESGESSLQHTKLQYIVVKTSSYGPDLKFVFPHTISLLWTLQTLHLDVPSFSEPLLLPSDIWEMSQLRHLTAESCILRDPLINRFEGKDSTVLENLCTLSSRGFRCSEEAIKRVPNLKKLKSSYGSYRAEDSCYCLSNLARLNKLESLSLEYYCLLEDIAFPASLKKLSLFECEIPWAKMTIIGSSLPNLEVLKLNNAGHGYEWDPIEGEFLRLKVLLISHCDLVRWGAEDIHFPILQSLSLRYMHKLEEIPLSIGDIDTLCSIHLERCSQAVKNSAEEILKDQEEKGNETLQVYVDGKRIVVGTVS
ncbi:ToMV resistant protein Tm-2 netted virescent [Sesamum angolense]|uniref:ToMV resistant protein Tm-2 netted virescent n=1 Tax=Sesamum angolense TaxID=2727404 RepID=A0AAE1WKD4_9LAMI|nr:ToMV resistant protein Tm-2 netted virescent [Sesamum angolense]